MSKILGYVVAIVGIVGLALWVIPELKTSVPIPIPEGISENLILIVSLAVTLVGIFLIMKGRGGGSGKTKGMEVPIYHGKRVVGYRRG